MRIGLASTEWLHQDDGRWLGGGTLHYRFRLPGIKLAMAGHLVAMGVLVRPRGQHRFFIRRVNGPANELFPCDVVVLQRYMNAGLPQEIAKAREAGQVVINDVDDYFDGLPESNRAFWTTHPDSATRARGKLRFDLDREPNRQEVRAHIRACEGCQEAPRENREHYRAILAAGDAIFASTAFLYDRMSELGRPVYLLRNAIDLDRFQRRAIRTIRSPVATWYGALGFRAAGDFDILRGCLSPFLRADPERRFIHGGSTGEQDRIRMMSRFGLEGLDEQVGTRLGVPVSRVQDLLEGVDVSLVPLEDCDFNQAKSALKGLESAAAGVPFIASPTSEYKWFDQGILASTTQEWCDALESLCDPAIRQVLADRARERVEEVGIDRTWPGWLAALQELVARR